MRLVPLIAAVHSAAAMRVCTGMQWTSGTSLDPCDGPEHVIRTEPTTTRDACFDACVSDLACAAFRPRNRTSCDLLSCLPQGRRRGNAVFGVPMFCDEVRTDAPSSAPSVAPTSFVPSTSPSVAPTSFAPSTSPTFAPITLEPTYPKPTATPTVATTGAWRSPSRIPESVRADWSLFYLPQLEPCEILRPSRTARTITWHNWGGTMEDCAKECQFDPKCGGFVFTGKTCSKSTSLEYTDVLESVSSTAFVRTGFSVSYWSGICSTAETRGTCASFPTTCAWNQGKRGINQVKIVQDGWCGRLPCTAQSSSASIQSSSSSSGS